MRVVQTVNFECNWERLAYGRWLRLHLSVDDVGNLLCITREPNPASGVTADGPGATYSGGRGGSSVVASSIWVWGALEDKTFSLWG